MLKNYFSFVALLSFGIAIASEKQGPKRPQTARSVRGSSGPMQKGSADDMAMEQLEKELVLKQLSEIERAEQQHAQKEKGTNQQRLQLEQQRNIWAQAFLQRQTEIEGQRRFLQQQHQNETQQLEHLQQQIQQQIKQRIEQAGNTSGQKQNKKQDETESNNKSN